MGIQHGACATSLGRSARSLVGWIAAGAAGLGLAATALAEDYGYAAETVVCSSACDSFASWDITSLVGGAIDITTVPGGAWGFEDVGGFGFQILNPDAPLEAAQYDAGVLINPTTVNPMPVNPRVAALRESAFGFTTGGETDADNELSTGFLLFEFTVPPLSNNLAWLVFDIALQQAQLCLFFHVSGCIPGATEAMVLDGDFRLGAGPALGVAGACPGAGAFVASGVTPGGPYVLLRAPAAGMAVIPAGPCAGATTNLSRIARLAAGFADADGQARRPLNLLANTCGNGLQLLDLTSCALSNLAVVPEP